MAQKRPSFEELYVTIDQCIEKRRRGWTLVSVDFDDVKQIILIHVHKKLKAGKFDPRKVTGDSATGFARWLNGLISSQISNIRRDQFYKFNRPCISSPKEPRGCPFNSGGDGCSKTASGKQCNECPVFAAWEKRKISHFNIKQPLPIVNHVQEVNNLQGEFLDVAAAKAVIDKAVMEKLTETERRIYRLIYIKGKDEKKVGKALGFKKTGKMHAGYLNFLKLRHKVVSIARQVIEQHGLA